MPVKYEPLCFQEYMPVGCKNLAYLCLNINTATDLSCPDHIFYCDLHKHDAIELIYIHEGNYTLQVQNDTYIMNKGDFCFIQSNLVHSFFGNEKNTHHQTFFILPKALSFSFDDLCETEIIKPLLINEIKFPILISTNHPQYHKLHSDILILSELNNPRDVSEYLLIKACLLSIIAKLARNLVDSNKEALLYSIDEEKNERLLKVLNYIENHYPEKINLDDLAMLYNANKDYFSKTFKKVMGVSALDYLSKVRVEKACCLINQTDKSMLEIALLCGFRSESHFIQVFKKFKHMTPGQFEKYGKSICK